MIIYARATALLHANCNQITWAEWKSPDTPSTVIQTQL